MKLRAPINIDRNAFVYDNGIYKYTLELADDNRWRWQVDEYVPAPIREGGLDLLPKASGLAETAEDALRLAEENLARIDRYDRKETYDRYAG